MIKMDMSMISTVLLALLFINTIAAFITVFRKPRSIASVFAWMMTLVFILASGSCCTCFVVGGSTEKLFINLVSTTKVGSMS